MDKPVNETDMGSFEYFLRTILELDRELAACELRTSDLRVITTFLSRTASFARERVKWETLCEARADMRERYAQSERAWDAHDPV